MSLARAEELLDINTKFVEAKRAYELMLDESWARHNAAQAQQQAPHLAQGSLC
jgi:hypothetical protein